MTSLHTTRTTRSGFTLVEMLVSTGLVLLIMLIFTQVFSTAVGTMTDQRSMAENDQKARIVTSILRSDLKNMTYRQPTMPYGNVQGIVPMIAGDQPIIDPQNQRGYFYYSENEPNADWDDVLQFTVMLSSEPKQKSIESRQNAPFIGKAANLGNTVDNQPDQDDGLVGNNQGESRAAEVSYFLRGGNLYRRVLLLRDPIPGASRSTGQPTINNGTPFFGPTPPSSRIYPDNFWRDFDYAAIRVFDDPSNTDPEQGSYLWFHNIDSLYNNQGETNYPIALPQHRYGHNNNFHDVANSSPFAANFAQPREFAGNGENFIGRFTIRETTSDQLLWPGRSRYQDTAYYHRSNPDTNPLILNPTDYSVDGLNNDTNSRFSDDLLMSNVESFDVKIVDPTNVLGFAHLGQSGVFSTNLNPDYGPHFSDTTRNNIFDTWHPNAGVLNSSGTVIPFAPRRDTQSAAMGLSNWTWAQGATPAGFLRVPALVNTNPMNDSLIYIPFLETGTEETGAFPPNLPPVPGAIVQDGDVQWHCIDNRVGLRGLQITIRYRDIASNLPRQVTVVHSFVE